MIQYQSPVCKSGPAIEAPLLASRDTTMHTTQSRIPVHRSLIFASRTFKTPEESLEVERLAHLEQMSIHSCALVRGAHHQHHVFAASRVNPIKTTDILPVPLGARGTVVYLSESWGRCHEASLQFSPCEALGCPCRCPRRSSREYKYKMFSTVLLAASGSCGKRICLAGETHPHTGLWARTDEAVHNETERNRQGRVSCCIECGAQPARRLSWPRAEHGSWAPNIGQSCSQPQNP